ncbi:MAG: HEPN domain-containing protein [Oscillospiraceae bacterium]|nr:HEPN domain-containing protein [Oscillospiraceae bacterium]
MNKDVNSYYDFAEEDYELLKFNVESGKVANAMCALANSIVERYLKHVIDVYFKIENDTDYGKKQTILKTHSLKGLCGFIKHNSLIMDFDHNIICQADGFHRSARYPSDDSLFVTKDDVDSAWKSVQYCKLIVDDILKNYNLRLP